MVSSVKKKKGHLNFMNDDLRQKVALFRFSIIAPIINSSFGESTAKEYIETVCAKKHDVPGFSIKEYTPGAIKDWLYQYRKNGFDGLIPKVRCDIGKSRSLSREAKEFIFLKKK